MPEVYQPITVDVTTVETAKKSRFLQKRHVIIEAWKDNKGKIRIGLAYDLFSGRLETEFDALDVGEKRFYGVPPNKQYIAYVWYYADNANDGFNIVASDGAMTPFPSEHRETTVLSNNTGLKATTWTTILEVTGLGTLIGIGWKDADGATQNEYLRLTIDDNVMFSISTDVPNYDEYFNLIATALRQAYEGLDKAVLPTTTPLPFRRNLKIEYYRAAAGTVGLSIRILYTVKV